MAGFRGAALAAALCGAAALSGCSTATDIAEQSVRANLGVERAENAMLVLNALRAADRRPTYFTSVQDLSIPSPGGATSFALAIPLNGGSGSASAGVAPGISYFTVSVLDSQKFVKGITTPLKPSLLRYYFNRDWPPMLLLSLAVREIDYPGAAFVNDPDSRREFEAFQDQLSGMLACGLRLFEEDVVAGLQPPSFDLPGSTGLMSALAGLAKDGFIVVPQKDAAGRPTGRWQLARPRGDVLLDFATPDAPGCLALPAAQRRRFLKSNGADIVHKGAVMDFAPPDSSPRVIRVVVRSPDAILHYLGDLARVEERGDRSGVRYTPRTQIGPGKRRAAIFKVGRAPVPDPFVSVEYDGVPYYVASGPADRSSQSLAILSLLLGLQKEASEVKVVPPLRVIGP